MGNYGAIAGGYDATRMIRVAPSAAPGIRTDSVTAWSVPGRRPNDRSVTLPVLLPATRRIETASAPRSNCDAPDRLALLLELPGHQQLLQLNLTTRFELGEIAA
jgi:hypothetical protein